MLRHRKANITELLPALKSLIIKAQAALFFQYFFMNSTFSNVLGPVFVT
jgi:hypothetical protein